jgi:hypothetical protein
MSLCVCLFTQPNTTNPKPITRRLRMGVALTAKLVEFILAALNGKEPEDVKE